jgi:hypothetical protein
MNFLSQNDLSEVIDGAQLALIEVRTELGLPKSGDIVYPQFYLAKYCYQVVGKEASKLKNMGYQFAMGILVFGGPHMYFFYKSMGAALINILFVVQLLMFAFYMYKRHAILKRAKIFSLGKRPLPIYTKALSKFVTRSVLIKGIVAYILFFVLLGGFFTYSVFISGYYILFLFLLGCLLWLSVGAVIMSMSLKDSISR